MAPELSSPAVISVERPCWPISRQFRLPDTKGLITKNAEMMIVTGIPNQTDTKTIPCAVCRQWWPKDCGHRNEARQTGIQNPTPGIAGCCARATRGHTAALPSSEGSLLRRAGSRTRQGTTPPRAASSCEGCSGHPDRWMVRTSQPSAARRVVKAMRLR